MSNSRPAFIITIDTEGDNQWSRPREIRTENARFLPRFQQLCDKYGMKPTYLTNWEMANDPAFREFGKDVLARGTGEIGMHLHAWNSPPLTPASPDDFLHHPFLVEYEKPVLYEKIKVLTDCLETTFGRKMVSHRAGRWAFDETYAQALLDHGYLVDCSVTPYVKWPATPAAFRPRSADFTRFPREAYFVDVQDIQKPGGSKLLEVPMTIVERNALTNGISRLVKHNRAKAAFNRIFSPIEWLRPNGRNLDAMKWILSRAIARKERYVEFMLHSSEFMPGGSPKFMTTASIDKLYDDMDALFSTAASHFDGQTLGEFRLHSIK